MRINDLIRRLMGVPLVRECLHLRAVPRDRYCVACGGRLTWSDPWVLLAPEDARALLRLSPALFKDHNGRYLTVLAAEAAA